VTQACIVSSAARTSEHSEFFALLFGKAVLRPVLSGECAASVLSIGCSGESATKHAKPSLDLLMAVLRHLHYRWDMETWTPAAISVLQEALQSDKDAIVNELCGPQWLCDHNSAHFSQFLLRNCTYMCAHGQHFVRLLARGTLKLSAMTHQKLLSGTLGSYGSGRGMLGAHLSTPDAELHVPFFGEQLVLDAVKYGGSSMALVLFEWLATRRVRVAQRWTWKTCSSAWPSNEEVNAPPCLAQRWVSCVTVAPWSRSCSKRCRRHRFRKSTPLLLPLHWLSH